jgi:Sigma-70 region 2
MAGGRLQGVIRNLRTAAAAEGIGGLTDGQLLERFVTWRDEGSFELLVWRHGAMVLATCRRVLRDPADAEDAFQAAFLVFLRKAATIGRREAVAGWLHKVALRAALRLRTKTIPVAGAPRSNPGRRTHPSRPPPATRSGRSSMRKSPDSPSGSARPSSSATWKARPPRRRPAPSGARGARFCPGCRAPGTGCGRS